METLILDCNYLCHRARFVFGQLSNSNPEGLVTGTGVIYGFISQMHELMVQFQTNDLIFCWDSKTSIREKSYPEYKRPRKTKEKTEEDIEFDKLTYPQFTEIFESVIPALGFVNNFKVDGLEGDDIMASIVQEYDADFIIITSDEDMYQTLNDCDIWHPQKKKLITKKWFINNYGIEPKEWSTVKAIAGCSSDNVAGVKGVGEKTAIKYLLKELQPTTKKYKDIVSEEGQEIYKRNIHLVTLPHKLTPSITIEDPENLQIHNFIKVFEAYGFDSMLTPSALDSWEGLISLR